MSTESWCPPEARSYKQQGDKLLRNVPRWQKGLFIPTRSETDLEHTNDMDTIFLTEFPVTMPVLVSEVNAFIVLAGDRVHDIGEWKRGDLNFNHPNHAILHDRWKLLEFLDARYAIRRGIDDSELKEIVWAIYKRMHKKDSQDKEALVVDVLDKTQGNRFGFMHVFNGHGRKRSEREMYENHFDKSIARLRTPIETLRKIVSEEARAELQRFFEGEIKMYGTNGYRQRAESYLKNPENLLF